MPPLHYFPAHHHRQNQLIYSIAGSVTVLVANQRFVCGPEQAVWIPTHTVHEVGSTYGAKYRSLYVQQSRAVRMPARYVVLEVAPLLRELIRELSRFAGDGDPAYEGRVMRLILDQLPRQSRVDMSLPWPTSAMLRRLCEDLYQSPARGDDIAAWGDQLGASGRTLSRRFRVEVGLSFRDWRRRLRLVKSLELLGAGMTVTATSLELGYGSTSAFSYMFTREMGYSPKVHLAARSHN